MQSCLIPNELKVYKIILIPKISDLSNVQKYRLIALLCIPYFLQKFGKVIFRWKISSQNFGGKVCYGLKINSVTSKLEGCTVYYSCVFRSRPLRFSWLRWALESIIVFIWMTEKLNSNRRLKNLIVMIGAVTLWRSNVRSDHVLGRVLREFLKIVPYFVKWVFWGGLRTQRSNCWRPAPT